MRRLYVVLAVAVIVLGSPIAVLAQSAQLDSSGAVPRLINITGVFRPADGQPPAAVETVTLSIYAESEGGAPLWQETQRVALDDRGRYTLMLGATHSDGIPPAVFASGAQWLATWFERAGEVEGPRVRITSVPYALRASDAETLGGRPASDYLRAGTSDARATAAASDRQTAAPQDVQPGTTNFLAKYVSGTDVGNSAVYETGGLVGIGTSSPADALHVRFTNTFGGMTGLAVQNLGNTATSYSGMLFYDQNGALGQFQGFNNATHEYRINNVASGGTINFMVGSATRFKVRADGDVDISGSIRKGGVPFLASFGTGNTLLGEGAGNFTMTGQWNTASGTQALIGNNTGSYNTATGNGALRSNISGDTNTAIGDNALQSNTTGERNTASGGAALAFNTTGSNNTATGISALSNNISGSENTATGGYTLVHNTGSLNTASGLEALWTNTTGSENVAVGYRAGFNATTGWNNIYLGASVTGIAGESNTMYLGLQGTQTKTVIAGIRGITTGVADAVPVLIDSAGQLGTVSSSRRFKEEIQDMGEASRAILALRPVTFRFSKAYANGAKPLQYGLVAEEVAEVFPTLAVFNVDGGVDTVHYETLSVLLLNELQKQHRRLEEQRNEIELLKARLAALEAQRR